MTVCGNAGRAGRTPWWLPLGAVVVLAGAYWLRSRPVAVTAHTVATGAVVSEVLGTGTLEARFKTTVSSKIVGRIATLSADQNDPVTSGQVLATLDDEDLRQQVEVAAATRDVAAAALVRAHADISRAEAVLVQAQLEFARIDELTRRKVAAQGERDKSRESLDIARAELDRSKAAKVEAEQQGVAAERALQYQQARLADAKLLCPLDQGLVTFRYREVGDVVVPGSAIMDVVSLREVWVSAWVDETAAGTLAPGQPARVVFRAEPEKAYVGQVARLGRQTDRETREFLLDVALRELPRNWTLGQRAEVYVETARREGVLVVPAGMLSWRDGAPGVFVSEGGRARWQALGLGLRGRTAVEVTRGLVAGQVAVVALGEGVLEGRAVKP